MKGQCKHFDMEKGCDLKTREANWHKCCVSGDCEDFEESEE